MKKLSIPINLTVIIMSLKGRNFLSLQEYTPEDIRLILNKACEFKSNKKKESNDGFPLAGKKLCLIFQKPKSYSN